MTVDPWKPWPPPTPPTAAMVRDELLAELDVERHAKPGPIRPASYRHQDCDVEPCIDCGFVELASGAPRSGGVL